MFRQIGLLLIAVAFAVAIQNSGDEGPQILAADVTTVENSNIFREYHPRAFHTPLERYEVNATIRYSVGSRVAGDKLVGNFSGSDRWPKPRDVSLLLTYPEAGLGRNITYAEAVVTQTSPVGFAYVTSGGPGDSHLVVVLGAIKTTYFGVNAKIYGN